jgi:photosystem II stability/assembly factor-like uncharacterized protein
MDPKLFRSLQWRCIGPHRGGRVIAVAGHPTEQGTFYFGACAGGVWKTTNAGAHWENISDGYFKTAAVGALAVSPSDPNVIYAGTGETSIRSNVSHGDGVYKSTDGGRSWRNVGLSDTRHIGDVVVHPADPDIAYVAALGHVWGENQERGVYRTTDGGASWRKVLYKSSQAGSHDIALDPHNPRILYAAIWQTKRIPHGLDSGGDDCGLWRSFDAGDTWEEISRNPGLPKGMLGKIGVAASPAKPGRLWALIEAEDGALFRSDDYGDTWQRLSEQKEIRHRPWYYMHVIADPSDAETLWALNYGAWKSIDGGKSFQEVPTAHGDNHALWIDPRDSRRLILGDDGGAQVSFNGGETWSTILNQPTAQFYHVTTDHRTPYNVYGSQQDNWAMQLPSIGFEGAISWKDYVEPGGGESGYIAVSPAPPYTVFGGGTGTGDGDGRLIAWNPETHQARNVTVWPEDVGGGAINLQDRFNWTFPVEISPHDPSVLYVTSQRVHRSTDEGASWEAISGDLTRNEPERLQSSGGPITPDNSGADVYCTIFAFRESPHEQGVFWAGTDDGLLHLSRDGGANWQRLQLPGLPEWSLISIVEPSPHDPASAYIAATAYKLDDTRPYLYKTNDYGQSWTKITNGIPDGEFTRVIREDPSRRGLLYAGTETGIWVSLDDGANWQRLEADPSAGSSRALPVTPIHDLVVKDGGLVVATHGRSFWILDDLSPLHQLHNELAGKPVHLFAPRPAVRYRTFGRGSDEVKDPGRVEWLMTGPVTVSYRVAETPQGTLDRRFLDAGQNPPEGLIVHYLLREKPEGVVSLAFLNSQGNVVREFASDPEEKRRPRVPAAEGANCFVWNLRYAPPVKLEPEKPDAKPEEGDNLADQWLAPLALPGEYRVRLTVGDNVLSETFTILPDPRLPVTQQDLQAQFELRRQIRDTLSEVREGVNTIRVVKRQLDLWESRATRLEQGEIAEAAKALKEKLTEHESDLTRPGDVDRLAGPPAQLTNRLAALSGMLDESDHAPTQQAQAVYDKLKQEAAEKLAALQQVLDSEAAAFNQLVKNAGIDPVS